MYLSHIATLDRDAANLPVAERVLSPFFVSRNTGARLTHVWGPDKRGTLSLGLYNDEWDIGTSDARGWDASARITGLAEGTLKSHLFRSRKRLQEWLAPDMGVAA